MCGFLCAYEWDFRRFKYLCVKKFISSHYLAKGNWKRARIKWTQHNTQRIPGTPLFAMIAADDYHNKTTQLYVVYKFVWNASASDKRDGATSPLHANHKHNAITCGGDGGGCAAHDSQHTHSNRLVRCFRASEQDRMIELHVHDDRNMLAQRKTKPSGLSCAYETNAG